MTAAGSNEFIDFHARRMVEMAAHIIIGYLLLRQASEVEEYRVSAQLYVKHGEAQNAAAAEYIAQSSSDDLDLITAVRQAE